MRMLLLLSALAIFLWTAREVSAADESAAEATAGWMKCPKNPVLGGDLGTCFDIAVLREGGIYRMWFSWRPKKSIALVESKDGIEWSQPVIVIGPHDKTDWESDLNRPAVIKNGGHYQMWYTGQARGKSWLGYATSRDGKAWHRESHKPVLSAEQPWEKVAVMCPHVLYDDKAKLYRMWYSGGDQYEPDAIGYATSHDGLAWSKREGNPIFKPNADLTWEKDRVTACQVVPTGQGFVMFYIGFRNEHYAQIGMALSSDGVTGWKRHPANPIIRPGRDKWDHDSCYKPFAVFDGQKWLLWYNGRRGGFEQIGLATHEGEDLGF
jgi:beta-1,2-mannobiose phosphorylase / 1,2-beta-oligomannan phosphorylase